MAQRISSKSSGPGNIAKVFVKSNDGGKTFDIAEKGSPIRFTYYESILQDVIHATITYVDTGNSVDNQTAVEGLPITGSESVDLVFEDVSKQQIKVTLLVNKVTKVMEDAGKTMVTLEMNSKELFDNDKIRINTRLDGKISEHVNKILKKDQNYIATTKEADVEDTQNEYNKICNNKKPFYMINWFCTQSAPQGKLGKSAGFMFWETSEKFHFKSIDKLFAQSPKKSIIFTDTPDSGGSNIPPGYDVKALDFNVDNRNNIQDKLEQGAYSTRLITFNPFNCYYKVTYQNAGNTQGGRSTETNEGNLDMAGKNLPKLNPNIKKATTKEGQEDFSRTTFKYLDVGSLPQGKGDGDEGQEQIEKSEEEVAKPGEVLNQAIMRMNQMNNMLVSITIPGDFSLHAGDAVKVDAPQLSSGKSKQAQTEVNKQEGGLYIIRDICHYMTPRETYTKINVVRDSVGRKV